MKKQKFSFTKTFHDIVDATNWVIDAVTSKGVLCEKIDITKKPRAFEYTDDIQFGPRNTSNPLSQAIRLVPTLLNNTVDSDSQRWDTREKGTFTPPVKHKKIVIPRPPPSGGKSAYTKKQKRNTFRGGSPKLASKHKHGQGANYGSRFIYGRSPKYGRK